MKQHKFEIALTLMALVLISVLVFSYQPETDASREDQHVMSLNHGEREFHKSEIDEPVSRQYEPITEEIIYALTEQFIDRLAQPSDQEYKVDRFETKSALIESFSDIASEEAVAPYIEFYYDELDDGLYIIPTALPPWVDIQEDYNLDYIDGEKAVMKQEIESQMYGHYRIEIMFGYDDGWRIIKIDHPSVEDDQSSLDTV